MCGRSIQNKKKNLIITIIIVKYSISLKCKTELSHTKVIRRLFKIEYFKPLILKS